MNEKDYIRFFSHVEIDENGCWNWTGEKDKKGYGWYWEDGKRWKTHRYLYTLWFSEIPEGLVIDHLCRNTSCCNPLHLEPVTIRENSLRGDTVNARNAQKTHCIRGHEFNAANTIVSKPNKYYPNGRRDCKECRKLRRKKRNERSIKDA